MGNICEIFSKNSKYDEHDDFIYYNKKNKEKIILPEIEYDEPPPYNSINYNQSTSIPIIYNQKTHPIPIVYDPSIQIIEYRRIYIDNYQDNFTTGVLAGVMIEDIFNCD